MTEQNIQLTFLADFLQEKIIDSTCQSNNIILYWAHNGPFSSFHSQNTKLLILRIFSSLNKNDQYFIMLHMFLIYQASKVTTLLINLTIYTKLFLRKLTKLTILLILTILKREQIYALEIRLNHTIRIVLYLFFKVTLF